MAFDLESMLYGSNEFKPNSEEPQPITEAPKEAETPNEVDLTNPRNIMLFDEWINASPEKRKNELVSVAFNAHLNALEQNKDKKITILDKDGAEKEISVYTPDGTMSLQGIDYIRKTKSMFEAAAEIDSGGIRLNDLTGKYEPEQWTNELYKEKKQIDPLPNFKELKKASQLYEDEDGAGWNFDTYVKMRNAESNLKDGDAGALDVNNESLREQFNNRNALDDLKIDDFKGKAILDIGGQKIINPEKVGDPKLIESEISKLDVSDAEKQMLLIDYKAQYNENFPKYLNEAAAAQASAVSILPQSWSGNPLAPLIGGPAAPLIPIVRDAKNRIKEGLGFEVDDLISEYERFTAENKGDAYEFAKQYADVFDKNNYSWGDKLSNAFWSAGRSTGAGFLMLGGLVTGSDSLKKAATDFASSSQAFTDMAYGGLMDQEEIAFGITNRDLYDVAGQVTNMMATFGTGSLIKLGLSGITKFTVAQTLAKSALSATGSVVGAAALGEVGEAVGGDTGQTVGQLAGGVIGGGLGVKAGGLIKGATANPKSVSAIIKASDDKIANMAKELADKNVVHRIGMQMLKDPSAYIGGLQATGTSFGTTYNQMIEQGATADEAYSSAFREGLASGAAALVATSVFNRLAPGAERWMTGGNGSLGDSFVLNMRSRLASKTGLEATKKVINELADEGVSKALMKGIKAEMSEVAAKQGLRGIGLAGDVAAESLEEFTDSVLSDLFSSMLSDSKNWTEDVWANRSEKFGEYVKAGVLGAFGGALGGGLTATASGGKTLFSKEERMRQRALAKDGIEKQWSLISENVREFSPSVKRELGMTDAGSNAVSIAEYVASFDGPITPDLIKEKSKAFVAAALNSKAVLNSNNVDIVPVTEAGVPEPTVPLEQASKLFSVKEPGTSDRVLQSIYGEGNNFDSGLEVIVAPKGDKAMIGSEQVTIHPVTIGNQANAAAMVVRSDGSSSYISPTKAKEIFSKSDIKKAEEYNQPIEYETNNKNEWQAKQITGSNADSGQKPDTSIPNNENPPVAQGVGNRPAPNDSNAEQAQRAEVALPTKGVTSNTPVTYTDIEGKSYPAVFQGYKSIAQGTQMVEIKVGEETRNVPISQLSINASPAIATATAPIAVNKATVTKIANGKYKVKTSDGDTMIEMSNDAQAFKSANEMAAKYNDSLPSKPVATAVAEQTPSTPAQQTPVVTSSKQTTTITPAETPITKAKVAEVKITGEDKKAVSQEVDVYRGKERIDALSAIATEQNEGKEKRKEAAKVLLEDIVDEEGQYAEEAQKALSDIELSQTKETSPTKNKGEVKNIDKINSLDRRSDLQKESQKANDVGIDVIVTSNKAEVEAAFEEELSNVTDTNFEAIGGLSKSGKRIIVINPKSATSAKKIRSLIKHEMLHVAEAEFRKTEKGKALWEKALNVTDKNSSEFDAGLESFMEKEYPGYSKLTSPDLKLSEVVRAFLEGKTDGFTSGMEAFKKYIKAFIDYVKGTYPQGSPMAEFVAGVEAQYQDWMAGVQSETTPSDVSVSEGNKPLSPDDKKESATVSETNQVENKTDEPKFSEFGDPEYIVSENEINNPLEKDEFGGNWRKQENQNNVVTYTYTPAEGKTIPIEVGTVVSIGTKDGLNPDKVLVLGSIVNNTYVYREVLLEDTLDAAQNAGVPSDLARLGRDWHANRLKRIADEIQDKIKVLLGNGNINDADFKNIINSVFAEIAPDYDFENLKYESIGGNSYLQARMSEDGKTSIVVDKNKMIQQIRELFSEYNPNNGGAYDSFVAAEVARQISYWASEEGIHVALLEEFKSEEDIQSLIKAANEIAEAGGNLKALKDLYEQTVAERYKDTNPAELTDEQKINVFHEVMRKVAQLLSTGSFTEMQVADSRMLLAALNLDNAVEENKSSVFKGLNTALQLIRRYMRKMRNMLFTRHLMGKLSPEMESIFQRVQRATDKANIRPDVDMISDKLLAKQVADYDEYKTQAEKDITKAVFFGQNSDALVALKSFVEGARRILPNLALEDIVEVDYKLGMLSLNKRVKSFVEQNFPEINVEAIEEALDTLNAKEVSSEELAAGKKGSPLSKQNYGRGETSVMITQMQLLMARNKLESARYRVRNILEMFDITNASIGTKLRLDNEADGKIILENINNIKDFFKSNTSYLINERNFEIAANKLRDIRNQILEQYEESFMELDQIVLKSIKDSIDNPTSIADQLNAFNIAEKIGYVPYELNKNNYSITAYVNLGMLGPQTFDQWLNGLMEFALTISNKGFDGSTPYTDNSESVTLAKMVYGSTIQTKEKTAEEISYETKLNEIINNKDKILDSIDSQLADLNANIRPTNRSDFNEAPLMSDFQNLKEYEQSLNDYNEVQRDFIRRSLGDFGFDSENFGMEFTDFNLPAEGAASLIATQWQMENMPVGGVQTSPIVSEKIPSYAKGLYVWGIPHFTVSDSYVVQSTNLGFDEYGRTQWSYKTPLNWVIRTKDENERPNPYYRKVHGNADLIGKAFIRDFFETFGQAGLLNSESSVELKKTGGFNFGLGKDENPIPSKLFPSLPRTALYERSSSTLNPNSTIESFNKLIGRSIYDVEQVNGIKSIAFDSIPIDGSTLENEERKLVEALNQKTIYGMLDGLTSWMRNIRSHIDGAQLTYGLPKKTTLAGHLAEDLTARLDEAEQKIIEYREHILKMREIVDKRLINGEKTIGSDVAAQLIQVNKQTINDDQFSPPFDTMKRSMELLAQSVGLTRTAYSAYINPKYQGNLRTEMSRMSRDASYDPYAYKTSGFAYLKEYPGDFVTDGLMEWQLQYFAGPSRKYKVGPTFAFESYDKFKNTQYAKGYIEMFKDVKFENKTIPVFEKDKDNNVIFEDVLDEDGNVVYEQVLTSVDSLGNPLSEPVLVYKKEDYIDPVTNQVLKRKIPIRRPKQKMTEVYRFGQKTLVPATEVASLPITMSEQDIEAYSINDLDYSGRKQNLFSMGEQSTKAVDAPVEWIKKRMDDPDRALRMWFSINSLNLGMKIGQQRSKESAREAMDRAIMFRHKLANIGSVAYTDVFNEETGEMDRQLKPNSASYNEVVALALDGLFDTHLFSTARKKQYMDEFTKNYQQTSNPTTLLANLIEFKAIKEKALLNKLRVSNDEVIADAIAGMTYEATAYSVPLPENAPKGDFTIADRILDNTQVKSFRDAFGANRKMLAEEEVNPNSFATADETEAILMSLFKEKDSQRRTKFNKDKKTLLGGLPIFYASTLRENETLFVSENKALSLLIQNTPNDTLIFAPVDPARVDGVPVGIRYFPGRNGGAGFIYAPQSNDNKASRAETSALITQALIEHSKIPENQSAINEFAEDVRNTLAPYQHIDYATNLFNKDAKALLKYAKKTVKELYGSEDRTLGILFAQHLNLMHQRIVQSGIAFSRAKFLERAVREAGMPLSYLETPNTGKGLAETSDIDAAAIGYQGGSFSIADNINLISELFTNPKFKELYDFTKLGDIEMGNSILPSNTLIAILQSVRDSNQPIGEDGRELYENDQENDIEEGSDSEPEIIGFDADNNPIYEDEEQTAEFAPEDDEGFDIEDENEETIDDELSNTDAKVFFDLKDLPEDNADVDARRIYNKTLAKNFRDINRILTKIRSKNSNLGNMSDRMLKALEENDTMFISEQINPSDAAMVRLLNEVLTNSKEVQAPRLQERQGLPNRQLIMGAGNALDSTPILPGVNPMGLYNRNFGTLTELVGSGMASTINFSHSRNAKYIASILSLSPDINDQLQKVVDAEYEASMARVEAAKEKGPTEETSAEIVPYFTTQKAKLIITEKLINEMANKLPSGLVDDAIASARDRILGKLNPETGKYERGVIQLRDETKAKLDEIIETREAIQNKITDRELDEIFKSMDDVSKAEAISEILTKSIQSHLEAYSKTIGKPKRQEATYASEIVAGLVKDPDGSYQQKLNDIRRTLIKQELGNDTNYKPLNKLIKNLSKDVNNDIKAALESRYGKIKFNQSALVNLDLNFDEGYSVNEAMAQIESKLTAGALHDSILAMTALPEGKARADVAEKILDTIGEAQIALAGSANLQSTNFIMRSPFAEKSKSYKPDQAFVQQAEIIDNLLKAFNNKSPKELKESIDSLLYASVDQDNPLQESLVALIKALVPTRTERLEVANQIGFLGNDKIQSKLRRLDQIENDLKKQLSDIEDALDNLLTKSVSPKIMGVVDLAATKNKDQQIPIELSFIPEQLAGRADKDIKEASKILKSQLSEAELEQRYDFAIKLNGLLNALGDFVDNYAADAYKVLKGDISYDSNFNYADHMRKALDAVKTESLIAKERFKDMQKNLEGSEMQFADMSPESLALFSPELGIGTVVAVNTDETIKDEIERKRQAKIKFLKNPKGANKRKEMFGRLVQEDGVWIMLGPTNLKNDLEKRFGAQGLSPTKVKQEVRKLVLDSLPINQVGTPTKNSIKYSPEYLNAPFEADFWANVPNEDGVITETNLKGRSRKEVADIFVSIYKNKYIDSLNEGLNLKGAQKYDINNEYVNKGFEPYDVFVRSIIYSYGDPKLGRDTQSIFDGEIVTVDGTQTLVAKFINNFSTLNPKTMEVNTNFASNNINFIRGINIEDLFHRVFTDIEGDSIINRLSSGLIDSPGKTEIFMNKYLHHQDARLIVKFGRDATARRESIKVMTYLDRGFDNNSGRSGYEVQRRAILRRLAESRKELQSNFLAGSSSLDQAKARTWAWLEGMKLARHSTLHARARAEFQAFEKGVMELKKYKKLQSQKSKDAFRKFVGDNHVDLMRDIPATDEIYRLVKDIFQKHQLSAPPAIAGDQASLERRNEWSLQKITEAQEALLLNNPIADKVKKHGQDLVDIFKGLADSIEITKALTERKDNRKVLTEMNSVVPMLYTYANAPGSKLIEQENKYVEDPKEIVAIEESSMFGGLGRFDRNKSKTILRPINLNGLSGIDALIDDAVYRINVAPNYNVLRKVFGRRLIDAENKYDKIEDSAIYNKILNRHQNYQSIPPEHKLTLGSIAAELESDIINDAQKGVNDTLLGEWSKWLSTKFIGGSLISLQQLFTQTVPAVITTPIKKLVVGDLYGAKAFLNILGKYGASMIARRLNKMTFGAIPYGQFADNLERAVSALSPWNIIRGGDGMEENAIVSRRTNRYGYSATKKILGRFFKEVENLQEKGLDITIASGERLVSRALYMSELLSDLKRQSKFDSSIKSYKNIEELLADNTNGFSKIDPVSASYARIKVNDMFGQADQSKKGLLFQTRTTSPAWNQVLRSITRFSNHTATTASNLTAFWPSLGVSMSSPFIKDYDDSSGKDRWSFKYKEIFKFEDFSSPEMAGRKEMRKEAIENFIGTLGQNIMFQVIKPRVLIPLIGYYVARLSGDDEDKATTKAAKFATQMMASDKDSSWIESELKALVFGTGSNALKEWRNPEAARKSMYADIMSKVYLELLQAVPVVGVVAGYSPTQSIAKPITDSLASNIMAMGSDIEVAKSNADKKGVLIYDYKEGWLENIAGITAPTSQIYDYGDAMYTSLRAMGLDDVTVMDYIKVAASQVFATREYRSEALDKMEEAIRVDEMREKKSRN